MLSRNRISEVFAFTRQKRIKSPIRDPIPLFAFIGGRFPHRILAASCSGSNRAESWLALVTGNEDRTPNGLSASGHGLISLLSVTNHAATLDTEPITSVPRAIDARRVVHEYWLAGTLTLLHRSMREKGSHRFETLDHCTGSKTKATSFMHSSMNWFTQVFDLGGMLVATQLCNGL